MYPIVAPPPASMAKTDPQGYLKELAKRGATFYLGPHPIPVEEALELVKKGGDATVDVSQYPKVSFIGC